MVNDLENKSSGQLSTCSETCKYCGAVLNPAFYFCLSCATPYKAAASVVSEYIPPKLSEGEAIKKKVPQVWTVFWTIALTIFAGWFISFNIDDSADNAPMRLIICGILIASSTAVLSIIYKESLFVQLRRFGFNNRYAWYGLAILVPMLGLNYVYHGFMESIYRETIYRSDMSETISQMNLLSSIIIICIIPAITEEIAFRGLIQHWLYLAVSPWRAVFISSLLFMSLHLSILSFPYLFCVGMLLGFVRHKTGSLYPCMLIHFLHNLAVVMYLFS